MYRVATRITSTIMSWIPHRILSPNICYAFSEGNSTVHDTCAFPNSSFNLVNPLHKLILTPPLGSNQTSEFQFHDYNHNQIKMLHIRRLISSTKRYLILIIVVFIMRHSLKSGKTDVDQNQFDIMSLFYLRLLVRVWSGFLLLFGFSLFLHVVHIVSFSINIAF